MIGGAIAKERVQDRIREAERERRAAPFRRARTRKVPSGVLAAVASLRARRRSGDAVAVRRRGDGLARADA